MIIKFGKLYPCFKKFPISVFREIPNHFPTDALEDFRPQSWVRRLPIEAAEHSLQPSTRPWKVSEGTEGEATGI